MPSPFPGMDPYLEDPDEWGGVHAQLIVAITAQLNRVLPHGLRAKVDQYVRVEEDDDEGGLASHRIRPDVFVPRSGKLRKSPSNGKGGGVALFDPPSAEMVLLPGELKKHRRVLIVGMDKRSILTAIEILSPSNKSPGEGRSAYLSKRNEYLAAGVNLVEIDLLRVGPRLPMGTPHPPTADYYLLVSDAARRPNCSIWSFTVRQPIPRCPVPLSREIPAAVLDFRECLDRVYEEGRYEEDLDYESPPTPPLNKPDTEWAAVSVFGRGKRSKKT